MASLTSRFPLTDEKRGERGERGRSSTDVNYRVTLSGSPTEPVAMATHSGYGPLWEGLQRTTAKHHGKQQRVWAPALCISGSVLCTDAFPPPPLTVVECVQNSCTFQNGRHFPVFSPTPTPLHHPECSLSPSSLRKQEGVRCALVNVCVQYCYI